MPRRASGRKLSVVPRLRQKRARLSSPERRRQIVEAAAELFSRHGFRGTTTREVAQAVGVSEATVFKHFATKEELYAAIIETKAQTHEILERILPVAHETDDAALLRTLAHQMISRATADPTLMRLLLFSALEGHALSDMFLQSRFRMIDRFLSLHIARRIAAGAFRSVDPLQAAWNFMGMVAYHVLLHELFGQKAPPHLTRERAVDEMVGVFLRGVRT